MREKQILAFGDERGRRRLWEGWLGQFVLSG
jgi:hypothetical protein